MSTVTRITADLIGRKTPSRSNSCAAPQRNRNSQSQKAERSRLSRVRLAHYVRVHDHESGIVSYAYRILTTPALRPSRVRLAYYERFTPYLDPGSRKSAIPSPVVGGTHQSRHVIYEVPSPKVGGKHKPRLVTLISVQHQGPERERRSTRPHIAAMLHPTWRMVLSPRKIKVICKTVFASRAAPGFPGVLRNTQERSHEIHMPSNRRAHTPPPPHQPPPLEAARMHGPCGQMRTPTPRSCCCYYTTGQLLGGLGRIAASFGFFFLPLPTCHCHGPSPCGQSPALRAGLVVDWHGAWRGGGLVDLARAAGRRGPAILALVAARGVWVGRAA
jgi:hypothetical protein